jgi:6-phosphogluconolactonase (cycloisomerase 2 family)
MFFGTALLCTAAAAQLGLPRPVAPLARDHAATPVAYVYVSSTPANSSNYEVASYGVAADGKLTAISGSPFTEDVTGLATNRKLLFGSNQNGIDIDAYTVESNGALEYASATDIVQGKNCDTALTLFLDRTGASLYNLDYDGNECANTTYQSFAINPSTGKLTFLDEAGASPELVTALSFIGNNQFGYGSSCYHFNPLIYGFARASNGALKQLSSSPAMPTAPANENYCPTGAAADAANHVAIAMQPMEGYGTTAGAWQLATYTANASGLLTTTSNYANMPSVLVGTVLDIEASPAGNLLAVAGTSGLQIFRFNGARPITKETGLLTNVEIDHVAWDKNNHLFAIGQTAGKMYAFTVTPKNATEVSGSPYAVSSPSSVAVHPL